ncbi:hypothetical protein ACSDR0_42750 [Streptosporangium sp. G11]|uniref:hypothetical protein n=1 Tax=Streptosporangium sp. G11 TaxID=3436926 RepID=UPI003EC01063
MSCLIERRAVEAAAVAGTLGALLGSLPADRGLLGGILTGTAAGGMLLPLRLPAPSVTVSVSDRSADHRQGVYDHLPCEGRYGSWRTGAGDTLVNGTPGMRRRPCPPPAFGPDPGTIQDHARS